MNGSKATAALSATLLLACSLLVTSCADQSSQASISPDQRINLLSSETYVGATVDPGAFGPIPKDRVSPDIKASNVGSISEFDQIGTWILREKTDGGRKLLIGYSGATNCALETEIVLIQNDSEVIPIPIRADTNENCNNNLMPEVHWGILTLDAPLGNRKLLHLPTPTERIAQAALQQ